MRVPDESLAPLLPAAEAKLTSSTLGKRIIRRAPPEVGLREEGRRPR